MTEDTHTIPPPGATFVHLRLHTEFSLVNGIVRIKDLMNQTAELGMPAVAMTDQSNLFAMVKFYRAARAKGVKPIFGVDALLKNSDGLPGRLVLLCQNDMGYRNLTELISQSYMEGQDRGQAFMSYEWLKDHNEGLIVLSGGTQGALGQALINDQVDDANAQITFWQKWFPDRFYLELQRTGRENENLYIERAIELAVNYRLPVVATNDVHFLKEDDFDTHEARVCIHDGMTLNDTRRPKLYSESQYMKSAEEMQALFSDIPEALANTIEIAKRCSVELTLGESVLPEFPVPAGMSIEEFLAQESRSGLEKRLLRLRPDELVDQGSFDHPFHERLDIELKVINDMGFPGYFLIVADFIQWAKDNDIPVGPGRGSGAGSLVAYALGITDLDPLKYELLFERFLNPERVSMPDFDIDFCMDKRDDVIRYVSDTYGADKVSQIITYGTMAAKAVVRDVGRIMSHPYGFVDRIAKLVPFEVGMTLTKALEQEPELKLLYKTDEEVQALLDLALKLEGLSRNAGKHAGGVVIAPSKLTDFSPLYCEPGGKNLVTQFDKDDVEAIGLVKFDFLGLRTLTIIDWAVKAINRKIENKHDMLEISEIPLDDADTFTLLQACKTTAVFQLESHGMKNLIADLRPDSFEEIIALVALFRPGPLQSGMVDDFNDRKHGRSAVSYPHPDLEAVLEPTYGVILYQEQVMQIAQILAGYTLGGADLLRRAMGKKKASEMEKQRAIFVDGATGRGVDERTATYIFDLMEKFAGYGFNKSHSAAYALLSYQTAWLKTHHPAAFMSSVLSADMDNTDKIVILIDDTRQMELSVLPPDVNKSDYRFRDLDTETILYGLGAIKGVGEAAIESIIEERGENGPYQSLDDLCHRINTQRTSRKVLESMIQAGALDGIGPNRASMLEALPEAVRRSDQRHRDSDAGQDDMFGGAAAVVEQQPVPNIDEWPEEEKLQREKDTLGLYLTGHPINRYLKELAAYTTCRINKLMDMVNDKPDGRKQSDREVVVAGLVVAIRTRNGKNGRMAFVTLDDRSARIEIMLFSQEYEDFAEFIQQDKVIVIDGNLKYDHFSGRNQLRARDIFTVEHARSRFARYLQLTISNDDDTDENLAVKLQEMLMPYRRGSCPIVINYTKLDSSVELKLGKEWQVIPSDACLHDLRGRFGNDKVVIHY